MSFASSPRFLSRVLWADAASCVGSGALQLALSGPMARGFGLPGPLLVATGLFLVGYGLLLAVLAVRPQPPRALVALCALGNLGWAAGCAAAAFLLAPSGWGIAWLAMQAACVLVLADLQWLGLRRSAGGAAAPAGAW